MYFFMEMKPPTATTQEHSVKVIKGEPFFFDPPDVRYAKELLMGHLIKNKPEVPIEGAVELTVLCSFRKENPTGMVSGGRPDRIRITFRNY